MHLDAEGAGNPALQVLPAPAHHPVPRRSGPASTQAPSSAIWAGERCGTRTPFQRSDSPARPSAFWRRTQSRKVCRSIPQVSAARVRSTLSNASAKASIRRAALASRLFPAALRHSAAVRSRRAISIPDIAASHHGGPWIERKRRLEIPRVRPKSRWYEVFRPFIWLIGFKRNRYSSDVQILQTYSWGVMGFDDVTAPLCGALQTHFGTAMPSACGHILKVSGARDI